MFTLTEKALHITTPNPWKQKVLRCLKLLST
jgi:hypothetical protein